MSTQQSVRYRTGGLARHLVIGTLAAAALFPLYYLLVNSVKDRVTFAGNQLGLPPAPVWSNYGRAWDALSRPVLNTVVIVGASVTLTLLCAALTAYAFSILQFTGWKVVYFLTFILLLIPGFLLLLPLYLQITSLPIAGGYLSIILPSVAATQAFSIVILKAFFDQIPRDLVDSARLDGASELRIFRSIVAPLSRPVLTSVGMIQVVALWNDYLLPQLVLEPKYRTVSVAMVAFTGNPGQNAAPDFGALMAGYVLSAVPLRRPVQLPHAGVRRGADQRGHQALIRASRVCGAATGPARPGHRWSSSYGCCRPGSTCTPARSNLSETPCGATC